MTLWAYSCGDGEHRICIDPAVNCIVSWSASRPIDIDVRVQIADGRRSGWLPYVRTNPWRSCSSADEIARIEVDVITGALPIVAVEVRAVGINGLFVATPVTPLPISYTARVLSRVDIPLALNVPAFSQYVAEERGWCAAASLAMVMVYWARVTGEPSYLADVPAVAHAIYDAAYDGTGNWTFATAFANMRGLRATVAYLRNLDHAQRLLMAQIPLVLSVSWEEGQLHGAPLPRSNGHLLVLRGFDSQGYALVNDPALPEVTGRYRRTQLESVWLRAGGICYAIAPRGNDALLPLLNR